MKQKKIIAIVAILITLISLTSVGATNKPSDVLIVSTMALSTGTGTFMATGPAVDNGLICPDGDVVDLSIRANGWQGNKVLLLFVEKQFICEDGSGSIFMNMNVHLVNSTPGTTATWRITSGSDTYEKIGGVGSLTGYPTDPDTIVDIYQGKIQ